MRLLLDSNVLIWWLDEDPKLDAAVADQIEADERAVMVSAASVWEIEIKRKKGALRSPNNVAMQIQAAGFHRLPMTYLHAHVAGGLPRLHDDPFDRMLVAQTKVERAILVTSDRLLAGYGIPVLPARR